MKRIPGPLAMLLVLVVTNLILFIAGCASLPRTASDVAGIYDLFSVDEQPLPILEIDLRSGWLRLESNGSLSMSYQLGEAKEGAIALSGTFSLTGPVATGVRVMLVIDDEDDDQAYGVLTSGVLTITADGDVLVFKKRR